VVKIVDFGVAKAAGRTGAVTGVGHVKGKPPYMSPEQALSLPVDRRTDIFALGIVLYQITAGHHPLRGETDVATLQNIVAGVPIQPPSARVAGYPRELEAVVMKALERDPDRRFQSARELELALEDCYGGGLRRARAGEVGEFLSRLLGRDGEERRAGLQQAIRLADQRVLGASVRAGDAADSEDVQTVVERPQTGGENGESTPGVTGVTRTVAASVPDQPRRPKYGRWIAGGVLTTAALIAAVVVGSHLLRPVPEVTEADRRGETAESSTKLKAAREPEPAEMRSNSGAEPTEPDAGLGSHAQGDASMPSTPTPTAAPRETTRQVRGRRSSPNGQDLRRGVKPADPRFVPPPIPNPGF
jgi:serine/threonine-protein kinase